MIWKFKINQRKKSTRKTVIVAAIAFLIALAGFLFTPIYQQIKGNTIFKVDEVLLSFVTGTIPGLFKFDSLISIVFAGVLGLFVLFFVLLTILTLAKKRLENFFQQLFLLIGGVVCAAIVHSAFFANLFEEGTMLAYIMKDIMGNPGKVMLAISMVVSLLAILVYLVLYFISVFKILGLTGLPVEHRKKYRVGGSRDDRYNMFNRHLSVKEMQAKLLTAEAESK